ncbi:MAG TPA: M3 family metallopeptidase [Gemmatimonadaceae bacterium]|nr:M3 family metallopeptidase [Gemmatimonadaceae bacterium]
MTSLDRLRRDGQALMEDVSREYYLAHAGLKSTAELQPIYARHAEALGPDALAMAVEDFAAGGDGDARRSARLILEWQVETHAARLVAPSEEREIAWESTAMVRLSDGSMVPYQRAGIEIANSTDRGERLALDAARASLVERELAPMRRDRLQQEKSFVESLHVAGDYIATFEAVSGVDLKALAAECSAFLKDTEAMWSDWLPPAVKRSLGVPVRELTRADALALFRAREFDRYFPADEMEPAVRRQVREMGIDPDAAGRVRFDVGERDGKRARAFCAPVRVPEEVYLVLRPHGGQTDWSTLLHELGHALHFAYTRADYPFEYRWVGDNSVTESYAMLFDHLMQTPGWLVRYSGLSRQDAGAYLRTAALEELHYLRRYCAKLLYEVELYGDRVSWDALPDLYVETLSSATTFRYQRADAFIDVDPRFYAARYLRAWQLGAVLADALVERFDQDWYRNPNAGPWIVGELFAEGQRELASELSQRVAGRGLGFDAVRRALERLVG